MPEETHLFLGAFDFTCCMTPAKGGSTPSGPSESPMKAKLLSNFCSIPIPANKF